jgi:hypothetical protein
MPPATSGNQHNAQSPTMPDGESRSRLRRNSRKKGPKPWFVLKLSIGLSAAIIAYSSYVYIGRLCIPMIRRERNSLGSRTLGSECLLTPPGPPVIPRSFESGADHFCLYFFLPGSCFFGCVCCAWDDDDLGVYQGALLAKLFVSCVSSSPHPSLILGMFYLFFSYRRSCALHQDMPSR